MRSLRTEYIKRKEEKECKIGAFIQELRGELVRIWDHCLISEDEKNEFEDFHSTEFTEELLKIHKEELKKWKMYEEKNQEVLDKASTQLTTNTTYYPLPILRHSCQ